MEFAVLAQSFEMLEGTSSRRELVRLVTTLFHQVERPEEIQEICYLMQGRVAPLFVPLEMGMAEKAVLRALAQNSSLSQKQIGELYARLGDLGLVAAQIQRKTDAPIPSVSVNEVFTVLHTIAQTSGKRAIEKKRALLAGLLDQVDGTSAKYVVRMLLGKLRLGIGDATILDALASAKWSDARKRKLLEGAYHITSDLGLIARTIWEHPESKEAQHEIERLGIEVGRPIRSQLAERLPTPEAILDNMGPVVAQYKYDGFRAQIHKNGQQVAIFSRNLENLTEMFPEIVEATRTQVKAEQAIVDAEVLAYHATSEEFLPFQETTRRRRKHGVAAMVQELPLKAFVFDLLYKDGASLLDQPLEERLKALEKTVPQARDTLMVARSHLVDNAKTLTLLFDEAISEGLEGLVVKRPESRYEAGARNYNWVKIKRHAAGALNDTIDGVLLGYLFGRGKRAALGAGALLVGVYDPKQDRFVSITKIGTGLSDEQWGSIRERTKGLTTDHRPARVFSLITPSVWLEPEIVVEVLADEITRSPNHTAGKVGGEPGYALRFPRLVAFRNQGKGIVNLSKIAEIIQEKQTSKWG